MKLLLAIYSLFLALSSSPQSIKSVAEKKQTFTADSERKNWIIGSWDACANSIKVDDRALIIGQKHYKFLSSLPEGDSIHIGTINAVDEAKVEYWIHFHSYPLSMGGGIVVSVQPKKEWIIHRYKLK